MSKAKVYKTFEEYRDQKLDALTKYHESFLKDPIKARKDYVPRGSDANTIGRQDAYRDYLIYEGEELWNAAKASADEKIKELEAQNKEAIELLETIGIDFLDKSRVDMFLKKMKE